MKRLLHILILFILSGTFTMGSAIIPQTVTRIVICPQPLFSYYTVHGAVSNTFFDAEITPSRNKILTPQTINKYNAFDLTIKNNTNKDIALDWNKTMYIQDNTALGGFMYEGIAFAGRNQPRPPDIIHGNSTFTKSIIPNSKILFDRSWTCLPLIGEVGVYLVVQVDGQEIVEKLLVVIESKD